MLNDIKNIIDSELPQSQIRELLLKYHENDIAEMTDEMEPNERAELFRILGNEAAADVLLYSDDISEVVENMEPAEVAEIIETMDADDAIDVLEELDDEQREEIVSLMEPDALEDINIITQYDDDMIGSKMTTNFISIKKSDNVKEAMKKVIAQAAENDNVSTIYVEDEEGHLYGVMDLRDLIIARPQTNLETVIKTNYPSFKANMYVSDVVNELKEYALDSYPIVDENNKMLGVITSDDVVEVVDEEAGEDYAKLAGLTEEEDLDESVFKSIKKRIPWLIVLLVLGLAQAFSMSGFENVVACLPIIVFFQTLVLDMAGNTGTQSLAVTIRLLSTGEIGKKEVFKAIFKEIRVGFFNGLILSILSFAFVFGYLWIFDKGVHASSFTYEEAFKGAGIVGMALLIAMTVSSFVGSLVPIFFSKIHIDPAVASGPFITTINDITALLIYYGLAAILFASIL